MPTVSVNFAEGRGRMKPMQAVNNGPVGVIIPSQPRNNFDAYKAARIPYCRNHDASEWIDYGGEFVVDIYNLFPDFDADPDDPKNYEFAVTDALVKFTQDTGTEIYYRLGARIEHQCKKYRTRMPKDFKKWAVICEHVIRHYNEGWADGFHYNLQYWEIWNEPDLDPDDKPVEQHRTWGGTAAEFYEFYAVAATHLKRQFPHLKIGGPGLAHHTGEWLDGFLAYITRDGKRAPLDFFSWHWYGTDPRTMLDRCRIVRKKIDAAGYTEAESHLGEWNYVANWGEKWLDTVKVIISLKGAAFVAACMCEGQNEPTMDMMMYYEVSPTTMNGVFDFYTCQPIKGYWALYGFSDLYDLGTSVAVTRSDKDVYATAAKDESGNAAILLSYYTSEDGMPAKDVTVETRGLDGAVYGVYTVDETHDYTLTDTLTGDTMTLKMQPNTFAVLKRRISSKKETSDGI